MLYVLWLVAQVQAVGRWLSPEDVVQGLGRVSMAMRHMASKPASPAPPTSQAQAQAQGALQAAQVRHWRVSGGWRQCRKGTLQARNLFPGALACAQASARAALALLCAQLMAVGGGSQLDGAHNSRVLLSMGSTLRATTPYPPTAPPTTTSKEEDELALQHRTLVALVTSERALRTGGLGRRPGVSAAEWQRVWVARLGHLPQAC